MQKERAGREMIRKLIKKIVTWYLSNSSVEIREKDNGFTNIVIKHSDCRHGLIVIHPEEEKGVDSAEEGFIIENTPLLRFMNKFDEGK